MSIETTHEYMLAPDQPTPRQLFGLASSLILFANRHDRLRLKDQEGGRRYLVSPTNRYERPEMTDGAPFGYLYNYSLGAIAHHHASSNDWSMRIFDSLTTTDLGSQRGGSRTVYSFNWSHDEVSRAHRTTIATPARPDNSLEDLIDRFYVEDEAAWRPSIQLAYEKMTADDVDYFQSSVNRIISDVDADPKERPYKERRKNYLDYYAK